jgi:hypothetical protein
MDLKNICQYGRDSIVQYCPPLCFELSGQMFELVMDDGYDFFLNFTSEKTLEWNRAGAEVSSAHYECLKGDESTYLVSYELENVIPRVNHTFVIDMENMLVTRIIARIGQNPKYPYLISTEFDFGAIRREASALTFKRHGYTSDMIGTAVEWTYGSSLTTVHIYYCANFYRLISPRDNPEDDWAFTELMRALPSSDEPAVYIKIKDGMYLFSLTEQNAEKLTQGRFMFRSNTLCFLQNYKRLYQVGRGFGTSTTPDGDIKTNIMIGAYGKFAEVDPSFFTDPNPYVT